MRRFVYYLLYLSDINVFKSLISVFKDKNKMMAFEQV